MKPETKRKALEAFKKHYPAQSADGFENVFPQLYVSWLAAYEAGLREGFERAALECNTQMELFEKDQPGAAIGAEYCADQIRALAKGESNE